MSLGTSSLPSLTPESLLASARLAPIAPARGAYWQMPLCPCKAKRYLILVNGSLQEKNASLSAENSLNIHTSICLNGSEQLKGAVPIREGGKHTKTSSTLTQEANKISP